MRGSHVSFIRAVGKIPANTWHSARNTTGTAFMRGSTPEKPGRITVVSIESRKIIAVDPGINAVIRRDRRIVDAVRSNEQETVSMKIATQRISLRDRNFKQC